jgi:hypothetical protein
MSGKINTIQELEDYFYGSNSSNIMKEDAPVLSSTTGVYNAVYGKLVWALFNQEANVLGLLPKSVWNKSGWRLQTARATSVSYGGVSEGGAVPDTIKPTWVEVVNTLKTVAHSFDVSEIETYLSDVEDDAIGNMEYMREVMGIKHKEDMNVALLADASAEAAAGSADYAGKTGFETIDRVISSDSEEDAFGGTYNAYFDIFGLDRDSATTYDSYVSHNSGTDRAVSDSIVRTAIWSIAEDGGNTTVMVTGYDTIRSVLGLYSDEVRYSVVGETGMKVSVNGIDTDKGINFGARISTLYGIPLIPSKDVTKDTISRIYLLDTSDPEGHGEPRIGLDIAKPTQYFETGIEQGNPFAINKFNTEGLYRTLGEIKCTALQTQGKIRDLL